MERVPALSSRAAVVVGTTLALAGLGVVWVALYSPDAALGAPRALVVLAGVMFVLAGAATIIGFAVAGGSTADGQLPPGTPLAVRLIQLALGLGITGIMAALAGWIAFGPGQREFGLTIFLPFVAISDAASEMVGRAAFAVWAGAATLLFVVFALRGARHIAGAAADRPKTRTRSADRLSG
ncbi:MAG TPA: hypothetical protein VID04_08895 [Methylomirabilota bacterium]|jgi:hypothetical protein